MHSGLMLNTFVKNLIISEILMKVQLNCFINNFLITELFMKLNFQTVQSRNSEGKESY